MNLSHIANRIYYKVLSPSLCSLGYNRCTIIQYRHRKWNHPLEQSAKGMGPGGLWVTKTLTKARSLRRYGWLKHKDESVIHTCIVDKILYRHRGSGRAKTNKLFLLDRVWLGIDRWKDGGGNTGGNAGDGGGIDMSKIESKIEGKMGNFLDEIKGLIAMSTGVYDSSLDDIPFDTPETRSLAQWIAKTGGVRDVTLPGELRDLVNGNGKRAKGIPPGFLNNDGRGFDEIVDEANSDGWNIRDESDLIGILEQEQREAYNL